MAIFHCQFSVISRAKGKSCLAASAYRSGERLHDERQNINHDYTKRHDIESEIIAPENSPSWVYDREKLWNEVDKKEIRCNSRTAREINVALPIELSKEQQKELAREYIKTNFVGNGMIADLCFHFNGKNNPHFHVMLTTREINENGFTKKNRDWDKKENVTVWREQWSIYANSILAKNNIEERIDHRSLKDQGIDLIPTIHLGKAANEMSKKGIPNVRAELNNKIRELNKQRVIALQEYRELKNQIKKIDDERYNNLTPDEITSIKNIEQTINMPFTFKTGNQSLEYVGNKDYEYHSRLSELNYAIRENDRVVLCFNEDNTSLKNDLDRLERWPKNIFGGYKDKKNFKTLELDIEKQKSKLTNISEIKAIEIKTQDFHKEINQLDRKVRNFHNIRNDLYKALKILEHKEVRHFSDKYKDLFPDKLDFTYKEITNIKKFYENVIPLNKKDSIDMGCFCISSIDNINKGININHRTPEDLLLQKKSLKLTAKLAKCAIESIEKAEDRSPNQQINHKKRHKEHEMDMDM